jgi:hypothetical protein
MTKVYDGECNRHKLVSIDGERPNENGLDLISSVQIRANLYFLWVKDRLPTGNDYGEPIAVIVIALATAVLYLEGVESEAKVHIRHGSCLLPGIASLTGEGRVFGIASCCPREADVDGPIGSS